MYMLTKGGPERRGKSQEIVKYAFLILGRELSEGIPRQKCEKTDVWYNIKQCVCRWAKHDIHSFGVTLVWLGPIFETSVLDCWYYINKCIFAHKANPEAFSLLACEDAGSKQTTR